ncbi:MAG: transcriptional repressor LexA [Verrucomicrobiales bacterium]|nr:transcriptional repressor LexA [Verrucomicrobiales bacterium]
MLTQRQQEVMDFLRSEHRKTGIMPSTREIQQHFGFSSQTAAVSHLTALEKKGVIQKLAGKARALMFTDEMEREPIIDIPIYGQIPAGFGDDGVPEPEGQLSVDVRSMGVSTHSTAYALRVRGDSMIDAHIMDGDVVVMEDKPANNRDIVAALIDGETTLKRLVIEKRKKFLRAENADYPDLVPLQELLVQGVMVGLVRHFGRSW